MGKFYPLTYAQKAIWNVEKYAPHTSINNIAASLLFEEEMDLKLLEGAINILLKKNDAFKIRITIQDGEPVQYITEYQYYSMDYYELPMENSGQKLFEFQKQITEKPFSLIESPLFYGAFFKIGTKTVLYFKQHHLIADAWSVILTGNRILKYYMLLKRNEDIDNISEPSFIDYVEKEDNYYKSKRFLKNRDFWKKKIERIPEFIYIKNKADKFSTKANRASFIIPDATSRRLSHFCEKHKLSIIVLFVASFAIYINQITTKTSISFGTTILNRTNYIEKNIIGMFVNVIPIYLEVNKKLIFHEFFQYIFQNWKEYLQNSRYPHELILNEYRQRHNSKDDLFDVTISYQNAVHQYPEGFNEIKSFWYPYGYQIKSLNIHINHREKLNRFEIDFDYLVDLFTESEIERLFHNLINILNKALDNPNKPIASFELLSKEEKKQLIYDFNRTKTYCPYQNILRLFEKHAKENPDKTALIFEGKRMTYRELNEKANQMAWMLIGKGVKPNEVVGLLVKRSFEMFIGILGVLKAGGAYLPIDPKFPRKRIRDILEDSNYLILLTNNFIIGNTTWKGQIVSFNAVSGEEKRNNPNRRIRPHDPAYLIYTSGSTGKPKGVLIEHRSIANTIQWRTKYYRFTSEDVLLQIPPYSFDSSVEDIFSFLTVGASIVIIDQGKRLNMKHLGKLIAEYRVTHFLATPLLYNAMLDDIADKLGTLSSITLAGESVRINLVKKHFAKLPHVKLYNEYGPTENSVCSTVYQFSATDEEVLIGKPISNCRCYILNQDHHLLPVGIPGELYLGGVGLARGYVNNPELTEKKFIYIPELKERVYKTGDLAQWTPDGNLKFIERIDNQVKIRGFRIELGEIESNLLKHQAINEAVVTLDESDPNRKCLCAYFVSDEKVSPDELKEFLGKSLPDYMIPAYFVPLERLPLNSNGKVDRKKLPAPNRKQEENLAPPENPVEEKMVEVWREVLGVSKIGINDSFFELGGDSLDVIKVITVTYNENWDLSAQDFYKYKTIKKLADYIISKQRIPAKETEEAENDTASADRDRLKGQSLEMISFSRRRNVNNVLLTGATGFLGSHILFELLQLDNIKIHVLVRGLDQYDAQSRLYHRLGYYFPDPDWNLVGQKLTVINGDITEELFGLPETDYQMLRQKVDMVIHAAALVKHYGDDREFQKVNVLGVQNILKFGKDKYLTHISTTSVAGDYTGQKSRNLRFDETSLDIGQELGDNCYARTKYEAEKIVLEQMQNGMDGTIIRVGNLTGRYVDGVFQPNIYENKFYQILKSIITIGLIPNSTAETEIEMTPVDLCAKAVVKLIMMEESNGKTFHVFNQNKIKVKDFLQSLSALGYKIQLVEARLFEKHIQEMIRKNKDLDSLLGIIPDLKDGKLNYSSTVVIDSKYSIEILKHLGFVWQRINSAYIKKIFNHMYSVAFIKKAPKNIGKRKILNVQRKEG